MIEPTFMNCPCGSKYLFTKQTEKAHIKTQKHIDYINGVKKPEKPNIIHCPCGSVLKPKSKQYHINSIKHRCYLQSKGIEGSEPSMWFINKTKYDAEYRNDRSKNPLILCEVCDCQFLKSTKRNHLKSKKHQQFKKLTDIIKLQ